MNRFFIEEDQILNDKIQIIGQDAKHIRDVLRLRENDKVEVLFNEIIHICIIEKITKSKIDLNIVEKFKGNNESNINIILYQSLPKSTKMDYIVQKCTEVGVKEFYPIKTHRSIVKVNDVKKEITKIERWNNIVDESAKQSKRDILPKVNNILGFKELIKKLKGKKIIVAYENEEKLTMKNALKGIKTNEIHLIIGPEGGFENEEIESLKSIGAEIVTLGPRILRTETAGIVASTMILYELGDMD